MFFPSIFLKVQEGQDILKHTTILFHTTSHIKLVVYFGTLSSSKQNKFRQMKAVTLLGWHTAFIA